MSHALYMDGRWLAYAGKMCIRDSFLDYFESKEIGVINASPLSMGLLSERGVPAWHPAVSYTHLDVYKRQSQTLLLLLVQDNRECTLKE